MGDLDTAETMPVTEQAPGRIRDSLVFRDERARDAIVDAMLGLYHRGIPDPTALEIADQAGVSLRSVYYHFADLESLAIEAVGRQRAQIEPLMITPITTGTLDDRITETVERRCELYEVVTPVRRAALLIRHRSPTIDANLAFLAKVLRDQLGTTFAPELDAAERGGAPRCALLDALDLATSWEAWERLRASQALTRERARSVMHLTLRSLLR